jgi:hypothetical protein
MRNSFDERAAVDNALIALIQDGIERYQLNTLSPHQIDEVHVNELMELATDILGHGNRSVMLQLPKDKKIHLLLQLTVLKVDKGKSRISSKQRCGKKTNVLCRSSKFIYLKSELWDKISTG